MGRKMHEWSASASALLDWLRARVTRDMLLSISGLDYGCDSAEHHAALVDIWATGLLPPTLQYFPREVVSLGRWSGGRDVDHLQRAWCCAILAICPDGTGAEHDLVDIAPGLVDSCLALGSDASSRAGQLLAWRCETALSAFGGDDPSDEEVDEAADPSALLALLLLSVAADLDNRRTAVLTRMLAEHPWCDSAGLARMVADSVVADLWDDLIGRILVPARRADAGLDRLVNSLGYSRPVGSDIGRPEKTLTGLAIVTDGVL